MASYSDFYGDSSAITVVHKLSQFAPCFSIGFFVTVEPGAISSVFRRKNKTVLHDI